MCVWHSLVTGTHVTPKIVYNACSLFQNVFEGSKKDILKTPLFDHFHTAWSRPEVSPSVTQLQQEVLICTTAKGQEKLNNIYNNPWLELKCHLSLPSSPSCKPTPSFSFILFNLSVFLLEITGKIRLIKTDIKSYQTSAVAFASLIKC